MLRPLRMRFLRGKFCGAGNVPMGNSLTMAPPKARISSASLRFSLDRQHRYPFPDGQSRHARSQCAPMRTRVDSPRHSAHNQQPPRRQIARQHFRHAGSIRRWVAGADYRQRGARKQAGIASHPEAPEADRRSRAIDRDTRRNCRSRWLPPSARYLGPLVLGRRAPLAVKSKLRGMGGKPQRLKTRQRQREISAAPDNCATASTIRRGPKPGDSARASHPSRSSSSGVPRRCLPIPVPSLSSPQPIAMKRASARSACGKNERFKEFSRNLNLAMCGCQGCASPSVAAAARG